MKKDFNSYLKEKMDCQEGSVPHSSQQGTKHLYFIVIEFTKDIIPITFKFIQS